MSDPSPQQQKILDFVRDDTRSLIVEARAGSGKTTTLVMLSQVIPKSSLSLFLAFNKNIATELQTRLPSNIQAKTFHSHAFGALQRNLPRRPKVDGDKTFKLIKNTLSYGDAQRYGKFLNRLIGYGKNAGVGTHLVSNVASEWYTLIDHFNLQLDEGGNEETAVVMAMDLLEDSNQDLSVIDFDDMLYLALLKRVTFDKNNFVMLDEGQDTNMVQRELLKGMLAAAEYLCLACGSRNPTSRCKDEWCDYRDNTKQTSGGRLIVVGDPFQSIYGFRGADADAMRLLEETFNCVTLPLSVSYRCSKAVVKEARKILCSV